MAQVDNFYFFFDRSTRLERKEREITEVFQKLGVPLHEWQTGHRIKALGWLWWTDKMVMVCPKDKYDRVLELLRTLKERVPGEVVSR